MFKKLTKTILPLLLGLALLGPLFLSKGTANAANPTTINFQGKIVNASDGTNIASPNGTYSIVFRIYNTSSPTMTTSCTTTSSCLWQETQSSVTLSNGIFQVELGSSCALTSSSCNNSTGGPINFANSNSLYLTMQFNGDTSGSNGGFMSPLIHITSVPFALQADNASSLGGIAAANYVQLAQGLQTDTSSTNASIAINKTGGTANILTLQKSSANILLLDNNGLLTLQPAASLTSGQTAFTQTLTNASSTGGTVNGYSQTITVNNTTSLSTNNGIKISLTDNTALSNTNQGLMITLSGTNSSQQQIGANISVNHGEAIRALSTGSGGGVSCGNHSGLSSIGICATASAASGSAGVYGVSSGDTTDTQAAIVGSAGVFGTATAAGTDSKTYVGVKGVTEQSASASYTSVGVVGLGNAGVGAAIYGGYFILGTGGATAGAALYATNSGVAANILQLQNNNVNALIVNSNGQVVLGQSNSGGANGTIVFDNSSGAGTATITLAGNPTTNYTYQLPTGTVSSNQCLQSGTVSGGNVPLTFGACATGGSGYATIQDEATPLAAETALNFIGNSVACVDNSGSARTDCTIAPTLQNAYDNSGSPATITTSSSSKGILFEAGASSNSTSFFQLQNSSGSSGTLLNADTTNMRLGVNVTYTAMSAPSGLTSTASTGTGFTAGQSYLYEVTAIDSLGGETTVSNEPTACAPASTNLQCTLAWTAVTGASGYRVYRTANGGASGSEKYLTTVLKNSYIDTNAIALSSTNQPSSGNAYTSNNTSSSLGQVSIGGLGSPTAQVYVSGTLPNDISKGGATTGVSGGYTYGVSIQGRYAYVFSTNSALTVFKLQVFDVSNPAAPVDVSGGGVTLGSTIEAIYALGRYVYVLGTKLQVFDVSNPAAPVDVSGGGVTTGTGGTGLYVQGRYAYVLGNKLQVFDVSNPAAPVDVSGGGVTTGGTTQGLYVQGRYAYAVEASPVNKLQVFDVSNPAAPVDVSGGGVTTGTSPKSVYVQGRYAYVTDYGSNKLQVFDVSNPAAPVDVSGGGVTTGTGPWSIYLQGRYAYVGDYTASKLQVFNVSNPSLPVDISGGGVNTSGSPIGLDVQGRYAYVDSNYGNKLQVFDLGGTYTQQLEAGGAEVGTLQVDSNAQVAGDFNIQGGMSVGRSIQAAGPISTSSSIVIASTGSTGNVTLSLGSTSSNLSLTLPTSLPAASNYCIVSTNLGVLSFSPCGAGSTSKVVLTPEFVGAVMTPASLTGWTNSGTMTSDFCSGSSRQNINTSICTLATESHNYYSWNGNANCTNYDIWVRWSVPNDFASFSSSNNGFYNQRPSSNTSTCNGSLTADTVTLNAYTDGSASSCATQAGSGTTSWANTAITMTGCAPNPGDVLTFDIQLKSAVANDIERIGEITLNYNRN